MLESSLDLNALASERSRVAALAAHLIADEHGGEDLAQESVLRMLQARVERDAEGRMAWLRVAARRLAANQRRGSARRTARERDAARPEATPSSAEIAERAEQVRRIHAAIDALSDEHATALRDHYFGGLSVAAIAERDGVSANTVKSRIVRGRAALRAVLERDGVRPDQHWSVALLPLATGLVDGASNPPAAASGLVAVEVMKVALPVAVAAVVLTVTLTALGGGDTDASRMDSVEVGALTEHGAATTAVEVRDVETRGERTEIAPGDAATTAASSVTLRGRVVDTSGLPVEDARASLERRKPWIEGMAELRPGAFGYGARADAAGAFSIEFPLTEGIGGTIDVRGGEFRTLYRESLSYDELTAAAAAEGALGDVVLQPAGSLEGRVIDDTGRPVPGAVLATGPSLSSSYGLQPNTETLSREDGVFVLGHVPLGEIGIKVEARGHASLHLPAVAIERGRRVALGDVVLDVLPTPWLRGRVVDDQGIGVPRQWIFAGPTSRTGRSVTGRTDDDGRFDLDLVTAGPHKLKVERRDFLTVGGLGDPGPVFEPGSEAIEIRLERLPTTTFLVVDGVTGEPVRRFGLSVGLRRGSKAERRIHGTGGGGRIRDYPDGRLEAGARPGVDLVEVTAPGFRAFRGDVEHDGSAEAIQTIRLDRGATVRGIVLRGGQPVPGVRCWLAARRYDRRDGPKETVTDSEGGYTLRGLPSGTIEIVAGADDGSSSGRIQVTTHAGETVSALPIDLVGPGAIAGHVVVPDGVALEGLSVHLDDWQDDRRGAVSATGTFRFEDVEPGRHTVTLVGRPGELASSAKVRVEVEPGQTSKVRVNATSCGLCRVALTIATPGVDPRTVSVEILHGGVVGAEGQGTGPARSILREVRTLDRDGRIEFTEPATGVALVDLTFSDHGRFVLPEPRLHLIPLGEIEESFVVQAARLEVRLPDDLVLPEDADVRLWLDHEDLVRSAAGRSLLFDGGRLDTAGSGGGPAGSDRTISIDPAPPGRYVARVIVRSRSASPRMIELADGSYGFQYEGQQKWSRAVVLEPGATQRIQLAEGDRE